MNESSKHRKEMKKNILKATVVAAFALIAGFNVYNSQKSDVMADLALANVEALASGEIDVNTSYGYGLRDCKDSDGNLTGKRCELTHPYDTCNNKLTWGNCR